MSPTPQVGSDGHRLGLFNYLDESAESSLYRNGKVLIRRDSDGGDGGMQGVQLARHEMTVLNARALPDGRCCSLATNGFELLSRPLRRAGLDFLDQQQVVHDYYPQCAGIVEEAVGGRASAFDHNVRSAQGKKGQQVQEPAHTAHGDYTLTSASHHLRDLAKPPGGNDTLRSVSGANDSLLASEMVERSLAAGGRFAIISLWRNIASEPVATHPIALCDSQTVNSQDLVVFEIHYQDRIGENYFANHADRHR